LRACQKIETCLWWSESRHPNRSQDWLIDQSISSFSGKSEFSSKNTQAVVSFWMCLRSIAQLDSKFFLEKACFLRRLAFPANRFFSEWSSFSGNEHLFPGPGIQLGKRIRFKKKSNLSVTSSSNVVMLCRFGRVDSLYILSG
jgi:hypothetical protein